MGYRNNAAKGTATGDAAEGLYAVFDGTHYNGGCCFDYGNAETNSKDTGAGSMEAIYFGNCNVWGTGSGNGPWIMADLENGLFSGSNPKNNAGDPSINHRFVTAVVKGKSGNLAIRGGDAATGSLSTFYNGVRPNGYNPMKKQGAIILGIGGDNSRKQPWVLCSHAPPRPSVSSHVLRFTPYISQKGNNTPETFLNRKLLTPLCCRWGRGHILRGCDDYRISL